jgi:hypothetical protein
MGGDGKLYEVTDDSMLCSVMYDTPAYVKARALWERVRKSDTLVSILVTKKEKKDAL